MPGQALIVDENGEPRIEQVLEPKERKACSFERIYFSRGNDYDIYRERQALGGRLAAQVLTSINYEWGNTVFSFIPNTSETAFYGLMSALRTLRRDEVKAAILEASRDGKLTEELLDDLILRNWPRGEKVVDANGEWTL